MKNRVNKQLNNYYRRKKQMSKQINIPFKVSDRGYSNEELRTKDAVTLETIQRIANALEDILADLKSNKSKGGK